MLGKAFLQYISKKTIGTLVQREAPDFTAKAVQNGQIVTLTRESLLQNPSKPSSRGYALLIFYPLDFTFVCPTELTAYADRIKEFEEEGCRVVGISVDSEYSHLEWMKMKRSVGGLQNDSLGFNLPLISDLSKEITKSYGVLSASGTVALRAQILIDPSGIVRHQSINDLGIGRSVDESLRILQAVKWVDEKGEVCPVNWKPGQDAINTKNSIKFFNKI